MMLIHRGNCQVRYMMIDQVSTICVWYADTASNGLFQVLFLGSCLFQFHNGIHRLYKDCTIIKTNGGVRLGFSRNIATEGLLFLDEGLGGQLRVFPVGCI